MSSIQDKISTLGLKKERCPNAKWNDEEINYLKENYEIKSYSEMSKFLNRSEKSIKIKAHKLGLKKSGIYYDTNKFAKIIGEDDAYWLGFLYADGYVIQSNHDYFGIELQANDDYHLKKFNKFMNGNAKIYYRERNTTNTGKTYKTCSICFSGTQLVDNLINQGCIPRKSFIKRFPDNLNNQLKRFFIRGYFDGNGSFGKYNKNRYLRVTINTASYNFVTELRSFLQSINIDSSIYQDKNCYKLYIVGNDNPQKFLHYIYNDCNIYLDRKYKQYQKLCLDT